MVLSKCTCPFFSLQSLSRARSLVHTLRARSRAVLGGNVMWVRRGGGGRGRGGEGGRVSGRAWRKRRGGENSAAGGEETSARQEERREEQRKNTNNKGGSSVSAPLITEPLPPPSPAICGYSASPGDSRSVRSRTTAASSILLPLFRTFYWYHHHHHNACRSRTARIMVYSTVSPRHRERFR
jgi:hypothetical protein